MNIGDIIKRPTFKKRLMNLFYSIGASVVIFGAMAKLLHWKGASEFLMIGMSVEVVIFFVSAFEPLIPDIPDWKKVFPQLRENNEELLDQYKLLDQEYSIKRPTQGPGEGGGISIKDLPAEQVKKLNESFEKLAQAANEIKNLSGATLATENYIKNLQDASQSIGLVVESNKNVSGEINKNVHAITESYQQAAQNIRSSSEKAASGIEQSVSELSVSIKSTGENIKSSGEKVSQGVAQTINDFSGSVKNSTEGLKSASLKFAGDLEKSSSEYNNQLQSSAHELTDSYKKITDSLSGGFKGLEKSSATYVDGIEKLNKNMAALNAAYELHLRGAGKIEEVVKQYSSNVSEIGKLLHSSVEETKKFNDNTKEINENIQALNKVYGRMLGALNTKK
jgi:gliding motility-associated protein GldL